MDSSECENGGGFSLFPKGSLEGKSNYKQYYFIRPDGSIQKRVFLDVIDDRDREFIICTHYLMWAGRHFFSERTGIDIIGRDCPWDFQLRLNKEKDFFVEITAVADNENLHVINKREQRVAGIRDHETISLHELKKLNNMFPSEERAVDIARYHADGLIPDDRVSNPFFSEGKQLFTSFLPIPAAPLENLLRTAIEAKVSKRHAGKEQTVLILDNRTSLFDGADIIAAAETLETFLDACPFPEIWLYTGYFSDHDGQNSEFSFIALKLPAERQEQLLADLENAPQDERGRHLVYGDGVEAK